MPDLPDLRRVGILAIDTETCDCGLQASRGPGWPWRNGFIVGVSVAYHVENAINSHYFPLRHPDSENVEREQIERWLKDHIAAGVKFVTKNGLYDWGWLWADLDIKMPLAEQLEEIDALATIVDENRFKYSLDALCTWRGFTGKDEALLLEGCDALGLIPTNARARKAFKPQSVLWQLPARYVGPYAETDAVRTLQVYDDLGPILDREYTRGAYRLEIGLLPMVHAMRKRGIRVDISAAEHARDYLLRKRDAVLAQISEKLETSIGMDEINGRKWLVSTFDRLGIKYPLTEKGNPSFKRGKRGWLQHSAHWLPPLIAAADTFDQYANNFLQQQILGHVENGRVYGEIHPHRSDYGGTRSLRFSYSHPPLQQMPKHDEELAPLIRGVFLPEDGEMWASADQSQQEFRLAVHYAIRHRLTGATAARDRYIADPSTDIHAYTSELTGGTISRQDGKTFNFMKIYGGGPEAVSQLIKKSLPETKALLTLYDKAMPFLTQLSLKCQHAAQREGLLTLLNGARRHFNSWAPGGKLQKGAGPCDREEAMRRARDPGHPWHGCKIWRAETYKALNALIQGAAAIQTKKWMLACWREGIVPLLQMHDALELSVSSPKTAEIVARLGEEVVKLEVPMKVDTKFGNSWGDAKHTWAELTGATRETPKFSNDFDNGNDTRPGIIADDIALTVLAELPARPAPEPVQPATVEPPWAGPTVFYTATPKPIEVPPSPAINGDGFDSFAAECKPYKTILCPFHKEKTASCKLYTDGHYHCFGCGAHGRIAEDLNEEPQTAAPLTNGGLETLQYAEALWLAAQPFASTLGERYLIETRKLDPRILNGDALRFHPSCPFGSNEFRPCLLARFSDVEHPDVFAGIHRIGLTPDAQKIKRLTLGSWPEVRAIKLWPLAGDALAIGEGVETVIAAVNCGAITEPAWALGSRTNFAKFPVLPSVATLTILIDKDADPEASKDAKLCAKRWLAAGRRVKALLTEHVKDFNDLLVRP
ncbi:MAG: hypothetical protein C5B58_11770 [Acidobacteria bacterium]|nr:MAG: hypothetical protein C5B58_11770 [Acidobacteriota bacterium]